MNRHAALIAAVIAGSTSSAFGTVTWDFEDGTVQGWTSIVGSTTGSTATTPFVSSPSFDGSSDYALHHAPMGVSDLALTYQFDFSAEARPTLPTEGEFLRFDVYTPPAGGTSNNWWQDGSVRIWTTAASSPNNNNIHIIKGAFFDAIVGSTADANTTPQTIIFSIADAPTLAGQEITRIRFIGNKGEGPSNQQMFLDNITMVPEPGSMGLILAGSLLLVARRRRSLIGKA
ncbi:PEP-CTERM sorting domain-containing protein [Phycisphaerales bacterium AB-hyl4]|uniref:PEP-CTERM sorting domain-containing protein n=1 Tax=Natronomicrosphaera hydrolytica TaxID=3242702 RepID=A0ABV4U586_9BACT